MAYHNAIFEPTIGDSFGNGWKMLWKKFGELLVIIIITFLLSIPVNLFSLLIKPDNILENLSIYIILVLAYGVLVLSPVSYGVYFAFLKAARNEKVEIKDMFSFSDNYWNTVAASFLTSFIIGIGIVMLIIPGIFFACKLAFVPFLVIDKKMPAIDAIKTSWEMTEGHAINIFVIGFLSIFVVIGGIILFFIGMVISIMWIYMTIGSIYYAVDSKLNPVSANE